MDSEYPPEGPEAGQMLGKSQLIKKEPLISLFFFLNEEKGLGTNF